MDGTGRAFQRCDPPALGGVTLATNPDAPIEAAEIRPGKGIFRGVQYHPDLYLAEIAASTAHQSDDVTEQGLARDQGEVDALTGRARDLDAAPSHVDVAWQPSLNAEITLFERCTREIGNFPRSIAAGVFHRD